VRQGPRCCPTSCRCPRPVSGRIGNTYADSEADIISLPTAPAGAPNVLLILLDDVGFGQTSTFGGPANTPTLQKLADEGLRYNRFHTTALCSPTRRRCSRAQPPLRPHRLHHGDGDGLSRLRRHWPEEAACVAEILRATSTAPPPSASGTTRPTTSSAPRALRSLADGKGFDYFYGSRAASRASGTRRSSRTRAHRAAARRSRMAFLRSHRREGDRWIGQQKAAAPDKPFFVYFAPAPAHARITCTRSGPTSTREIRSRLGSPARDHLRETEEARPRPEEHEADAAARLHPSWDSRSPDEKRLYARMQEVFAGFLEHVDAQIGKLVDAIERMGCATTRSSSTSSATTARARRLADRHPQHHEDAARPSGRRATMLKHIDEIGGRIHENHYPVGWCWAGSSPFHWMKQVASHFGGTATAWSCRGRNASPIAAGCARSSTTHRHRPDDPRVAAFPNLAK
jgi:arylsulfatase